MPVVLLPLPLPPFTFLDDGARAAEPRPSIDVGVLGRVFVVAWTMRFGGHPRRNRVTTQQVLAERHRFQMLGVDAEADSAQMVNGESNRDWSDEVLIRPAMSGKMLIVRGGEASVTSVIGATSPNPATVSIDLISCREAVNRWRRRRTLRSASWLDHRRIAVPEQSGVVHPAQSPRASRLHAVIDRAHLPMLQAMRGRWLPRR